MQIQDTLALRVTTLSGKKVRVIAATLIAVLGLYVGLATPFAPALGLIGHKTLMSMIIALGLWIFKPLEIPFSVTAGLMLAILLISGVPATSVFAGYTSPPSGF